MTTLTTSISRRARVAALLAALVCVTGVAALAQDAVDEAVFCMGTTVEDTHGKQWAYLLWQTTDDALVMGKEFAVYAKAGAADSANLYERKAITLTQVDPTTIQSLLNRAVNLGDDLVVLEQRINALFLSVVPEGPLTLPEKVSAVIRGSLGDPRHFSNLVLLGRLHPSVNLCIGYAYAGKIPDSGKATFEVREFDVSKNRDLGVIGRVTVEAGAPVVLPAPGTPVRVPEANAKGDLNTKLRWWTPDDLRRVSLLTFGFNVYRMAESLAVGSGYDVLPPTTADLLALVEAHPDVVKINDLPVLKNKDFSAADVADFVADPTTYFLADDNDRYKEEGEGFEDGEEFYYFVTAVDVLMRDGLVSTGGLAMVCDRLWPDPPTGLEVINDYSYNTGTTTNKQVLKVSWEQHTSTNQDTVVAYYVYRWTNMGDIQRFTTNPLVNRIAGPIAHVPGEKYNSYVDDGVGAPNMTSHQGKTFWYTVRSEDDGACGGNLSANSAPEFGVLRDRVGPDGPRGRFTITCCEPKALDRNLIDAFDRNPQAPALAYYELVCGRASPVVSWAEFYAFDTTSASNRIGKAAFGPGGFEVAVPWTVDRNLMYGEVPFFCRVGTSDGKVSGFASIPSFDPPAEGFIRQLVFLGDSECQRVPYTGGRDDLCRSHNATDPGGFGSSGIEICLEVTQGAREYRVYRRVDDGPLTLIAQGEVPQYFEEICVTNTAMPANPGNLCYYGQFLDEHGNASPFVSLGCVAITAPLPKPLLAPLTPEGTDANKQMKILWFCPHYGVKRFQVWIGRKNGSLPNSISPDLSPRTGPVQQGVVFTVDGVTMTNDFSIYRTSVLGPGFGPGPAFEVTANLEGGDYYVFIKPVGIDDQPAPDSRNSNVEDFQWTDTVLAGPMVPWPARELPPLTPLFNPNIVAASFGIRIGEALTPEEQLLRPYTLTGQADPLTHLYSNTNGVGLFPVVAYRYQVANSRFPVVSGDIIQVSPLMEQIAHAMVTDPTHGDITEIHDPFIAVLRASDDPIGSIWLVDTQPVLANGRYVYLLVRFGADGEIAEVIPTPPVDIISP